jgi:pimeloyl-ACP methyl ester carboxylesterase
MWNNSVYIVKKPDKTDNAIYITENLKMRCLTDVCWAMAIFNISDSFNGYIDGTGAINNITCPVTLTRADRDAMISRTAISTVHAALPQSLVVNYQNCGHSPMVDMPDRLAADILAHINAIP